MESRPRKPATECGPPRDTARVCRHEPVAALRRERFTFARGGSGGGIRVSFVRPLEVRHARRVRLGRSEGAAARPGRGAVRDGPALRRAIQRPIRRPARRVARTARLDPGEGVAHEYRQASAVRYRTRPRENRPPRASESRACGVWLDIELRAVKPQVILALGGSAGKALLGKDFKISQDRGRLFPGPDGSSVLATYHPAYLLRLESPELETAEALVASDLDIVSRRLAELA
ncbi:MAG: uracil-DNA glycosylase family protein [Chloroflexia bacterium]